MMKPAIRKELQLLRRDPRVIVRLLVLPIAFIALFGMVFNRADKPSDQGHPIAVWFDPANTHAKAAITALESSHLYRAVVAPTPEEVQRAVAHNDYDVGLIFPASFDPKGGGAKAQLVIDTSRPLVERGPVQGAVTAIVTRAIAGDPVVAVEVVAPPGLGLVEEPSAFQLTVPGNAVLFGFFIALTCALSFAEERRTGTWRRLLATPVPRWKLLVAKLVPYVALGTVQVGLLFVIGASVFGMGVAGSVPALAVLTVGVAVCATGLGLALAAVSSTEKQISSLGSVTVLIMGLVGGCMLPRALMPHLLQQIGLAVPHGWALDGYYTLLVHKGAGFAEAAKPIAAVYGFAALFIYFGVRRFRFDR
jgi:ABC-2 type transport system permease protein